MSKSVFTKNRIKGFFVFLVIAAVVTIGVSVGLGFYFGHSVAGKDLDEGNLKDKLKYGESFTFEEIIEQQNYKFEWIKQDGVKTEVFAYDEQEKPFSTTEVLEYSAKEQTFKVVGVAKGFIRFSNALDDTVSFSVPFETSFSSDDTAAVLKENYPDKFANDIFLRTAIESVGIITFNDKQKIDLTDFGKLTNLKRINIYNSDDTLIDFTNFSLPSSACVYVTESAYPAYTKRDDEVWKGYYDRIFVSVENIANHSVVLYKNGGALENDNGKKNESLEVKNGGKIDLSEKYAMTKVGYTFDGWYTGDGKTFSAANKIGDDYAFTADTKLYAKWNANEYTVSLHLNDGTDEKTNLVFKYDEEKSLSAGGGIDYPGFYQIGWAYDENASKADFDVNASVKNLADENGVVIDVYAIWVYREFMLQFYTWNESKEYKPLGGAGPYWYDDTFYLTSPLGTPTSIHGSFVGWTFNPSVPKVEYKYGDEVNARDAYEYLTSKKDGVLKVYAVIELESYDLYYNSNGGDVTPESKNAISRGVSVVLSKPITKNGYKFKGWLDNAGYLWTSERLYSADKKWYDTEYVNALKIVEETNEGFNAPNGVDTVRSSTQVTLFAVFKANTFKVSFYGSGGSYYDDATVTYGRDFYFSGEMSKKGYSMKSCVFDRNYKSAGDSLEIIRTYESFLPDYPTVSLTGRALYVSDIESIYAYLRKGSDNDFNENSVAYFEVTWTANVYKVDFNYNGGTGSVAFKYVYYNGEYGDLPVPSHANEKSGKGHYEFYFNGWSYGGQKVTSSTVAQVAGDHTLVANWTKSNWKKDSCVATGTLVTLADGTYKKVEDLDGSETLLAWDFEKGKIVEAKISLVRSHGVSEYTTATLAFADGTKVKIIGGHGFFDIDLDKFVYLDESNYEAYIGHRFVKDGVTSVSELTSVTVKDEEIGSYSVWTAGSFTCFVNGMLSIGPSGDLFGFGYLKLDGLKFDEAALLKDIETYGLYTYDKWKDYMSAEQFEAFNVAYFKIAVGKGVITENGMKQLIAKLYQ